MHIPSMKREVETAPFRYNLDIRGCPPLPSTLSFPENAKWVSINAFRRV